MASNFDTDKIATSKDVALSNPASSDVLKFDATVKKWKNTRVASTELSDFATIETTAHAAATYNLSTALDMRQFGIVFDGITDNRTALLSALQTANIQNRSLFMPDIGPVAFSGVITIPLGVGLNGAGWSKSYSSPRSKFLCISADAQIMVGSSGQSLQGGRYGNFEIDGNNIALQPFKVSNISEAWFDPIFVRNAAGSGAGGINECAMIVTGAQNCVFSQLVISNNSGTGLIFDAGAGGLRILNYEVSDFGAYGVEVLQTVDGSTTPYPIPSNIVMEQGIIERGRANSLGHLSYKAGSDFTFGAGSVFAEQISTTTRSMVTARFDGTNLCGGLRFRSMKFNGNPTAGTIFDVGSSCSIILEGRNRLIAALYGFKLASGANVEDDGVIVANVKALLDPTSGGTFDGNIVRTFRAAQALTSNNPANLAQYVNIDRQYMIVSSSTTSSTTTLIRVSGQSFGPANVGGKITVPGAATNGTDLSTTIASVSSDGQTCVLTATADVQVSNVIIRFSEKYPRWQQQGNGSQLFGSGADRNFTTLGYDAGSKKIQMTLPSGVTLPWAAGSASVIKISSDESQQLTNSTSLIGDNRLLLTLASATTYEVAASVYYDGPASGNAQFGFTYPSGATGLWGMTGPLLNSTGTSYNNAGISTALNLNQVAQVGTVGVGSSVVAQLFGTITTTIAGQLQVNWAQQSADNSGALTVRAFSIFKVTPLI